MTTEVVNQTTGEITVARRTPSISELLVASGLTVVKQVTRTVLQQKDDVPFCIKFEAPIRESEVQEGTGRGGKPKMTKAHVADVVEYEVVNGEIREGSKKILICNTVMEGELNRNYPDNGFVGKSFLMKSYFPVDLGSATGRKSYKVYDIIEVAIGGGEISGTQVASDSENPVGRDGKPKK